DPARRGERGRRRLLPGPGQRELRERPALDARRRRHPGAPLPPRRRLRLLGRLVRPAARPRPARRRGRRRPRLPVGRERGRPRPRRLDRAGEAARRGRRRGPRRRLRPRRRAALPDRRQGARGAGRPGAPALPLADRRRRERPPRKAGLPGDRHEPGRPPRREHRLRDRPHARVAPGADPGGRAGRGHLRRRRRGGYVFPEFLPGYDAVAILTKLLELLAGVNRPVSALVADLPRPTLVHRQLPCPWGMKGLVMRVLNERFAGRDVDLTDGIKVFDERGWAQALPDPDEPLIHLYAEGDSLEASEELAAELRAIVEEIEQGEAASARM